MTSPLGQTRASRSLDGSHDRYVVWKGKGDSLTRPHGILPALKPNSVDWIPGAPPGKSLTGMQFHYEVPMRHRPEAFAAVTAIRGTPSPRGRPVDL